MLWTHILFGLSFEAKIRPSLLAVATAAIERPMDEFWCRSVPEIWIIREACGSGRQIFEALIATVRLKDRACVDGGAPSHTVENSMG
jgi:hypothetical protein